MDSNGLSKVFDAAETATSAIEEARPLLQNAVKLVDEVCCPPSQHLTAHYSFIPLTQSLCSFCYVMQMQLVAQSGGHMYTIKLKIHLIMKTCNRYPSVLCTQITPLLNELRQGNLVGNLEALTKSASEAAADIHNLQSEVCMLTCCVFRHTRLLCSCSHDGDQELLYCCTELQ